MTTLRTVRELQQHKGQSTRDQETHLAQVKNHIWSLPKAYIVSSGPLTSPDLPPTLWRTGRETKPRRIGINLQKNTIQVAAVEKFIQPGANDPFQTVTEGAPVQVRKYQIERRIFQVNPIEKVLKILLRNFWNWNDFKFGRRRQMRQWLWNSWLRDLMEPWKALQARVRQCKRNWENMFF